MINRVAVKQIIKNTPVELRNLARQERKVIIEASKKDPIGTAFQAAHGQFNYFNNNKLSEKLKEANSQLAKEAYEKNMASFIHRQPTGNMSKAAETEVVKASSYIG